jgi:hypothetical protein
MTALIPRFEPHSYKVKDRTFARYPVHQSVVCIRGIPD